MATAQAQAGDRALGINLEESTNGKAGVGITSVVADGPAAQAGIMQGDRIMAVGKTPISNYTEVLKIIAASDVNKEIVLDVTRGAWRASVSATVRPWDQVYATASAAPVATTFECCESTTCRPTYYWNGCYYRSNCGNNCCYYLAGCRNGRGCHRVGYVIVNGRRCGHVGYRCNHAVRICR
jgi:hypothetical protein